MRFPTLCLLLLAGCAGPGPEITDSDDPIVDVDTDPDTDPDTQPPPPGIGDKMPIFTLEDLNPSSPTFGQPVSTEMLAGTPFGLIFLDCRCIACVDVANDIGALYEAHPAWWDAQPLFGVNSPSAVDVPDLVEEMVVDNSLPYLQDVEEGSLWYGLRALNHDWYVVDADGVIEDKLGLYVWPDDASKFVDHMSGRYGQ